MIKGLEGGWCWEGICSVCCRDLPLAMKGPVKYSAPSALFTASAERQKAEPTDTSAYGLR